MSPTTRSIKKHAKARQRRRRTVRARLERDCRQAQQAAQALEQAIEDLGLPEDLVAELEGRLRSQQKLLAKICGMMLPPLFGCRTHSELCRVRGVCTGNSLPSSPPSRHPLPTSPTVAITLHYRHPAISG